MLRYAPQCSIPPKAESCQTSKGKQTATKKGKMRVAIPDLLARRQVLSATSGIIKKKVQGQKVTWYSPMANIRSPCALKVNFQIFGRRMRT